MPAASRSKPEDTGNDAPREEDIVPAASRSKPEDSFKKAQEFFRKGWVRSTTLALP